MSRVSSTGVAFLALGGLALGAASALAQAKYGPGTSATEIKVGQTIAYSGPASAYSQLGKVEAAYFKWLNAQGGINGRKINFISLDDGYSPPKAVENARKLVESDEVALVFNVLGTPLNMAIRPYMNQKKVPQLFIAAGATAFNDPAHFPWTMGWQPNLQAEATFYAEHLLKSKPKADTPASPRQNQPAPKKCALVRKIPPPNDAANMKASERPPALPFSTNSPLFLLRPRPRLPGKLASLTSTCPVSILVITRSIERGSSSSTLPVSSNCVRSVCIVSLAPSKSRPRNLRA